MTVGSTPYTCTYTRTAPIVTGAGVDMSFPNVVIVDTAQTNPVPDGVTVKVEKNPANFAVFKFVSAYKDGSDGDGSPTFGTNTSINISFNAHIPSPYVWYKIVVENAAGNKTASNVVITDSFGALPYGQNTATAICDPAPSSLAGGTKFECRYRVTMAAAATANNTVTATSPDVNPDSGDTATATANATDCLAPNHVVPVLLGLKKGPAATEWGAPSPPNAGFTGALTSWSGGTNDLTLAQSQQAFACLPATSTITIFRAVTP
jgi:hypothetical protein